MQVLIFHNADDGMLIVFHTMIKIYFCVLFLQLYDSVPLIRHLPLPYRKAFENVEVCIFDLFSLLFTCQRIVLYRV